MSVLNPWTNDPPPRDIFTAPGGDDEVCWAITECIPEKLKQIWRGNQWYTICMCLACPWSFFSSGRIRQIFTSRGSLRCIALTAVSQQKDIHMSQEQFWAICIFYQEKICYTFFSGFPLFQIESILVLRMHAHTHTHTHASSKVCFNFQFSSQEIVTFRTWKIIILNTKWSCMLVNLKERNALENIMGLEGDPLAEGKLNETRQFYFKASWCISLYPAFGLYVLHWVLAHTSDRCLACSAFDMNSHSFGSLRRLPRFPSDGFARAQAFALRLSAHSQGLQNGRWKTQGHLLTHIFDEIYTCLLIVSTTQVNWRWDRRPQPGIYSSRNMQWVSFN